MATLRYRVMNDNHRYVGETSPLAKHSDDVVEKIRKMHEEFKMSDRALAKLFKIPRRTVRDYINYSRRTDLAGKVVKVEKAKR